jgi:hypothetical protein
MIVKSVIGHWFFPLFGAGSRFLLFGASKMQFSGIAIKVAILPGGNADRTASIRSLQSQAARS